MSAAIQHTTRVALGTAGAVLNALPLPVIMVAADGKISDANVAAETFFEVSAPLLRRQALKDLVPFGSPLLALVEQVRTRGAAVNEYKVDLSTPRNPGDRLVDLHVAPLPEQPDHVVVMLQERTIADKMDRQLTHRGAARSVSALAAMLAHEIKNPLSGIRGAAQLLEQSAGDDDRTLTRLICDEADRIVKLVDRMEVFSTNGRSSGKQSTFMRCSIMSKGSRSRDLHAISNLSRSSIPRCRRYLLIATSSCRCSSIS
jgi:two-component system nitrogen regulation sensor histidine kinase GlnL